MLGTVSATGPWGQENPNPCSPALPDIGTGVPMPHAPGRAARTLLQPANHREHRPSGAAEHPGGCGAAGTAKRAQLAACLLHPSSPSLASQGIRKVLSAQMELRPPREVVQSLLLGLRGAEPQRWQPPARPQPLQAVPWLGAHQDGHHGAARVSFRHCTLLFPQAPPRPCRCPGEAEGCPQALPGVCSRRVASLPPPGPCASSQELAFPLKHLDFFFFLASCTSSSRTDRDPPADRIWGAV